MNEEQSHRRCRGCWQLGNNCGECYHCKQTACDGVAEIRRLRDENHDLRERLRQLESVWALNNLGGGL